MEDSFEHLNGVRPIGDTLQCQANRYALEVETNICPLNVKVGYSSRVS